jgi:UDP-glucose 4-epimerase
MSNAIVTPMRTIVTGGAGFIGSNLVDELVREGADVLVVDDLSHGSKHNLADALARGIGLAEIDVRDERAVTEAFTAFRPEVVFHLAAQIDVRASMVRPGFDAGVNILGSINVFASACAAGARRIVNTSTGGAIYGESRVLPTPETEMAAPISAYGLSKWATEEYAKWFAATNEIEIVTLRYGNVYGPRQDPAGDAGVIAKFCDSRLGGQRPVVYGDGEQTRDYVYVRDIVAANLAAAHATTLGHATYNVGSGREISVLDLIEAIAEVTDAAPGSFRPEFEPARPGEVRRSCLDVTRARRELEMGEPTPLVEGVRSTVQWIRSRANA